MEELGETVNVVGLMNASLRISMSDGQEDNLYFQPQAVRAPFH